MCWKVLQNCRNLGCGGVIARGLPLLVRGCSGCVVCRLFVWALPSAMF